MATIVVVDDEPAIGSFLQMLLENEGHQVRLAGDGHAALALVQDQRPDLVITDWAMPKLGGEGLCAALRSNRRTRDIPVIVMSAIIDNVTCNCSAFLRKPFDVVSLLDLIHRLLSNGHSAAGPTGKPASARRGRSPRPPGGYPHHAADQHQPGRAWPHP